MYENASGKWIADLGNGMYKNPILFSDYADPDVIRIGEDFFMIASSFTFFPGVPVLHSKDLVNWRLISYAVNKLPIEAYDYPQHGKGVWAPSIRFYNGRFYVFFASPDEGIFMTSTDNPFDKWDDVILIKEASGWIDPCPFWDEDGKAYLVRGVAKSRIGYKSKLFLHKMSADGKKLLDDGELIFDGRVHQPTIEGPKMYKRNGYYYILAPAGGVKTGWQAALRSKNIYGPYDQKVVMHQGDTPINGPHQGGLVELESGESWFIHFQDLSTYGRITHLQPVEWVNDWPIIGFDNNKDLIGEPVLTNKKPRTEQKSDIILPIDNDYFRDGKLGLQWQWQAHPKDEFYSFENDQLRLFAMPIKGEEKLLCNASNVLTQLIKMPNFEVTTKISPALTNGDSCGLIITGDNYYGFKIEKREDKLYLMQIKYEGQDIGSYEVVNANMEVKTKGREFIYLKIIMDYPGKLTFKYSYDNEMFSEIGYVSNFRKSGSSWVGARVGIFCVTSKDNSSGYADFRYVKFI